MANAAAAVAITVGNPSLAIEWLEQGRGVVWSQLLQLRTPLDDLCEHYPELASALQQTSRELEGLSNGSVAPQPVISEPPKAQGGNIRVLAERYKSILADIHKKSGFERFLLPKKLNEFAPSPGAGIVVVINVHKSRCDALIIRSANVVHVSLPGLSFEVAVRMRSQLVEVLTRVHMRSRDPNRHLKSEVDKSSDAETLSEVLSQLWMLVVNPILLHIDGEVSVLFGSL
jgi:hypothetical protein